jgi:predicted deacylase
MAEFEIAGLRVGPGEFARGTFQVGQWRGGLPATVPVMAMRGEQDGPTLWLDACIHGNEILNIEVIRRILREELQPASLRGTVAAMPVVNPFAFYVGQRGTPLVQDVMDVTDVHGVYPGDPNGTLNDRLAHRVYSESIKCENVINLHQNTAPAVPFTGVATAGSREVQAASVAMAQAFGLPLTEMKVRPGQVTSPVSPMGWPTLATLAAGRPTFIVELPPTGYIHEPSVRLGVLGLLNVLRHLGMLEGSPEPLPDLKVPAGIYGRRMVISNTGGMIRFLKDAGEWVEEGEHFAVIRDLYGDLLDEVVSPVSGYLRTLLFGPHNEAIYEGAIIASILVVDPNATYFSE